LRLYLVPALLPLLFMSGPMRRVLYRMVSQTNVNYRGSTLSAGQVGAVHGGDRLPWVKIREDDNFAPLSARDWQVHVYGEATNELQKICADRVLPLHVFPWGDGMARAGLHRNAVHLLRPDGYIAVAGSQFQAGSIAAYLDARRMASRAAANGHRHTEERTA
jgi:hypothetical protein